MKKILINYEYQYAPQTTAWYFEQAIKRQEGLQGFRLGQIKPEEADLILNFMPCARIITAKGVKSAYWEGDCHLIQGRKTEIYELVDYVFIAQSPFMEFYPKEKTYYLPHACDPTVHHRIEGVEQLYDVGFIGNDTYPRRRRLLDSIGAKYKLLRTTTEPGLPFSEALSRCKIAFNCSMNQDVNMRFFEAMAIGRMLITDYLPAQNEFAKEGIHYVSFRDWEDLDQKIAYYLEHEKEREKIAREGSIYIRRHHNYDERLKKILEIMK